MLVLLGAVILGAVVLALLPAIASTQLLRTRIAQELSTWSGYRVTLGASPRIDIWPVFRASLSNVSLTGWTDGEHAPTLTVERVEADLSALAALRGDVVFSAVRMRSPVLRLSQGPRGVQVLDPPAGGRLKHSVDAAETAVARDRAKPDLSVLPDDAFGTVEFSDGRIVWVEASGEEREVMSGLAGTIAWPALDRGLSLDAAGIWRGEEFSLDFASAQPLVLVAGGNAPLTFSFSSTPLTASFEGSANTSAAPYVDGSMSLAAPSLRRMLEWTGRRIGSGAAIGPIALNSRISGNAQRLKFEDAEVVVGGNPGTGVVDLSLSGPVPAIAGTLAFDAIDLKSVLPSMPSPAAGMADMPAEIDASFTERLNLDLRLSAARAVAGKVTLTNVAATAQIRDGLAAFDISDAQAFGGTVQTGVRIDRAGGRNQLELRLLATEIDGAAVSSALEWAGLVPRARGTISMILRGRGDDWSGMMDRADGSITAKFGPGAIAGIDLGALMARLREGEFFSLAEVSKGAIEISGAELKASVANGIARIEKGDIQAAERHISVTGILPYPSRGLALSGAISPRNPKTPALDGEDALFFVGGSWSEPFISPILPAFPE